MFIYPENLKAKPMLWLWLLRDIAVIGIGALLSVLALTQGLGMGLLVVTVLYAFLTIQVDGSSILDFLRRAACFLFLRQQYYSAISSLQKRKHRRGRRRNEVFASLPTVEFQLIKKSSSPAMKTRKPTTRKKS